MNVRRHNQHSGVFFTILVAIPQDFGRQHFKTVLPDIVHLDLNFAFVNIELDRHTTTLSSKGNFPMVQGVRIVPQFVYTNDGIFDPTHNDTHIPKIDVRRL